jgi:hypothetical protein
MAPVLPHLLGVLGDQAEADVAQTIATIAESLPCEHCRRAEADATKLPRLGKHERRVLLAAPAPDTPRGAHVAPPDNSPATAEAHRRAIRRLTACGLLDNCGTEGLVVERRERRTGLRRRWEVGRRTVRLSPLGQAVVSLLRPVLEAGGRIRWAAHRAALVAHCRKPVGDLLPLFREGLERCREWHKLWTEFSGIGLRMAAPTPEGMRDLTVHGAARLACEHGIEACDKAIGGR